jgi:hypothetical protein
LLAILIHIKPCSSTRLDNLSPLNFTDMNGKDKKKDERPIAYPMPTETDKQLHNQPEFIDEEPNTFQKEISDLPVKKEANSE